MSTITWRTVRLGEVCVVFDGPHATPKKTKEGPIYLGISNLSNGRLDLSEVEHLSDEDYITWTRRVAPKPGDVVFSYETRIGEAAQIPKEFKCCLGRRMGLLQPKPEKVDSRFLLYAFLGPQFQSTLHSHTIHGSTVDRISVGELPSYPIVIPPLLIQRRIAEILGRLDDKIEVNRRINRTLEAMAHTLYKHWFVDFGPFQDGEFVESELGLIPKGWEVGQISDLGEVITGKTPSTIHSEYFGGQVPFIKIPDMHDQVFATQTESTLTQAGADSQRNKYLPPYSVCVSCIATPGLVCITSALSQTNQQINSIILNSRELIEFTYCQMKMLSREIRLRGSSGSATLNLNKKEFENISIILPPSSLIDKFHKLSANWFSTILINQQESRKLTEIRDYLLPKLLSGEISVEAAIAEV